MFIVATIKKRDMRLERTHALLQSAPAELVLSCSSISCNDSARFLWPREVQDLFPLGIGIHHAGMLRADRNLMERAFAQGLLKV